MRSFRSICCVFPDDVDGHFLHLASEVSLKLSRRALKLDNLQDYLIPAGLCSASPPQSLTLLTMSAHKLSDDPELGTMNVVLAHPITIPIAAKASTHQITGADFIVNGVALDTIKSQLVTSCEKPNPPPIVKQPPRKVSRSIRMMLWFNTYRSVLT